MGDPKAFSKIHEQEAYRPVHEQYYRTLGKLNKPSIRMIVDWASRCMDCGIPFCHWLVLSNKQPEWQDALYREETGKEAYEILIHMFFRVYG